MANFALGSAPFASFGRTPGGGYAPLPGMQAIGWFAAASMGAPTYRRWLENGATCPNGGGRLEERYSPIEAASFVGAGQDTLIVLNPPTGRDGSI